MNMKGFIPMSTACMYIPSRALIGIDRYLAGLFLCASPMYK